jgi:hypothetical protein
MQPRPARAQSPCNRPRALVLVLVLPPKAPAPSTTTAMETCLWRMPTSPGSMLRALASSSPTRSSSSSKRRVLPRADTHP